MVHKTGRTEAIRPLITLRLSCCLSREYKLIHIVGAKLHVRMEYRAEQISPVLAAIRRRPGMYIGGTDGRAIRALLDELYYVLTGSTVSLSCRRIDVRIESDGRFVVHALATFLTPGLLSPEFMTDDWLKQHFDPNWWYRRLLGLAATIALSKTCSVRIVNANTVFEAKYERAVLVSQSIRESSTAADAIDIDFVLDDQIFTDYQWCMFAVLSGIQEDLTRTAALHPECVVTLTCDISCDLTRPEGLDYYSLQRGLSRNRQLCCGERPIRLRGNRNGMEIDVSFAWFADVLRNDACAVHTILNGYPMRDGEETASDVRAVKRALLHTFGTAGNCVQEIARIRTRPKTRLLPAGIVVALSLTAEDVQYGSSLKHVILDKRVEKVVYNTLMAELPQHVSKMNHAIEIWAEGIRKADSRSSR